ncbi:glycosyltransferase family 87 protein [Paraburkholderia acidisoli]|uniref:DUF2029 domain-containing protein n=1 Tax=Paraburkholderia acidisoli TaxID=2571748 RepID=A0A7Z2GEJ6_9BURK|nr:glycosyltransferase family 87 protein [Paraburkholderia acidisoli]QGZ60357.1 DUF2029 domain-containing protein [Paraburkholderia acidisoli]
MNAGKSMNEARPFASPPARHWLNPARLRAYSAVVLFSWAFFVVSTGWKMWRTYGQPNGMDFRTFWMASRLWLEGTPLKAYSFDALTQTAKRIQPLLPDAAPFFYPPNFLLLLRPLALVPCSVSSLAFTALTTGVFVYLVRKILPMRAALLPIFAFSGMWLNMAQGQNACLTASFALGAFLLLEKRPVLAGVCIGMLSIKPHLAILFPVALACAGMWTAFAAAAVTVVLFTGLSVVVFGPEAFPAFLQGMHLARSGLESGALPWGRMASFFATLRLVHVPVFYAYLGQACLAIVATVTVAWVWRRSTDLALRATALIAGTFMISPYLYNYDSPWLGVALAFFTAKALRDGWLRWEREIICVAWIYAPFGDLSGDFLHANFVPLVYGAVLWMAVRRVRVELLVRTAEDTDAHAAGEIRREAVVGR